MIFLSSASPLALTAAICCASFSEEMHSFTLDNVLPNLATIFNSEEFINALG